MQTFSFSATRATLGPYPVADLHDAVRGRRARIARRGATVLSLEVTHAGRLLDLADGYRDAKELASRPSSRFAVMVPFANRIADARFAFEGEQHDLQPGLSGAERAARHGFVRGADFSLASLQADDAGAVAEFTCQAIRPGLQPGYPFAIDLTLRYVLDARGLGVEARMRNVGTEAAPCFFGWHPYFRLGDSPMESWQLTIPAATVIATDADYIPLAGKAACIALDDAPALDFRQPRTIGEAVLNHGYTDLVPDADGLCRTHLRDPASGLALALWQERGVMLAFTADTVSRDMRRSIALEPMESWADAFNRPDCAAAIRLEPGQQRSYRCGVEILTA